MVTIVMLDFAYISRTEHVSANSAVKFHVYNEKNMSNILVPKSQKVWKNVKKIGLSSLATYLKYKSRG